MTSTGSERKCDNCTPLNQLFAMAASYQVLMPSGNLLYSSFGQNTLILFFCTGVGVPQCGSLLGAYGESHQLGTVLVSCGIWWCSHPSLHSLHSLSFCVLLQLWYVSMHFTCICACSSALMRVWQPVASLGSASLFFSSKWCKDTK